MTEEPAPSCRFCGAGELQLLVSRAGIERELELRREFTLRRLRPGTSPDDLQDLTEISFGCGSDLWLCRCGILVRSEAERCSPDFEHDRYTEASMERLLESGIEAYRGRDALYRPLLPPGAHIVEIGSYVGSFLHLAAEWGWTAVGVDIGRDTSEFANRHGYRTVETPLEQCGFQAEAFDGAFVWNTFEQLEDPAGTLRELHRIVRPGGVLVIRTPNALLYTACAAAMAREEMRPDDLAVRLLGYGNLLGFPHRFGFTPAALQRVAAAAHFALREMRGDAFISPAADRMTVEARQDEAAIRSRVESLEQVLRTLDRNLILSPWIEATFDAR